MTWRTAGRRKTIGKPSQRKGADGERELAALLRGHGYSIERGGSLSFGDVPDLTGLNGIHVEVKRCEQVRLSEWMAPGRPGRRTIQGRGPYGISPTEPGALAGDNAAF